MLPNVPKLQTYLPQQGLHQLSTADSGSGNGTHSEQEEVVEPVARMLSEHFAM